MCMFVFISPKTNMEVEDLITKISFDLALCGGLFTFTLLK